MVLVVMVVVVVVVVVVAATGSISLIESILIPQGPSHTINSLSPPPPPITTTITTHPFYTHLPLTASIVLIGVWFCPMTGG